MAVDRPLPGVKHFNHEGCVSYIFFDPSNGAAAVIDPRADMMDEYREFIAANRLKPVIAIDTHVHADHYSGTHFFAQEYRAEIGLSIRSESRRSARRLSHGDLVKIGTLSLECLETPGHTGDSACFYGNGMVFTGDTLLISSSGRTDFPSANPGVQWRSLREILGALPDGTLVFPGHDYDGLVCSAIGIEKEKNPHWLVPTVEEFVTMKNAEQIPAPLEEIRKRVEFNLAENPVAEFTGSAAACTACGAPKTRDSAVASINVEKLASKIQDKPEGCLFLDVREREEFRQGHLPASENIPLSEIGLHFERLREARRLYFVCLSGTRSLTAAKTVSYWGCPDAVNVSGGYRAWLRAGLQIEKH